MEFELRIKGSASEIEQIMSLLKQADRSPVAPSGYSLDEAATKFADGRFDKGKDVLIALIRSSAQGQSIEEQELERIYDGESTYGVIGGFARRWSSIAGHDFGSPFRKDAKSGTYLLDINLAKSLAKAFGE